MSLKLVPAEPKPERTPKQQVLDRVAASAPAYLLKCPRCGSLEFIETRTGVEVTKAGKHRGGTKALACLYCMMKGERVIVR